MLKCSDTFTITNSYREGMDEIIKSLSKRFKLALLSGDNEGEKFNLMKYFTKEDELHFNQSPEDKLNYIKALQSSTKKILMVGDGLNDAGALNQSNVGIAVTEDISNFSPACDAILDASKLNKLPMFLKYSKSGN